MFMKIRLLTASYREHVMMRESEKDMSVYSKDKKRKREDEIWDDDNFLFGGSA